MKSSHSPGNEAIITRSPSFDCNKIVTSNRSGFHAFCTVAFPLVRFSFRRLGFAWARLGKEGGGWSLPVIKAIHRCDIHTKPACAIEKPLDFWTSWPSSRSQFQKEQFKNSAENPWNLESLGRGCGETAEAALFMGLPRQASQVD
jgi:hypothetical protein